MRIVHVEHGAFFLLILPLTSAFHHTCSFFQVAIPIPDQKARERILRVLVSGMRLAPRASADAESDDAGSDPLARGPLNFHDPFDLALVAKRTPGFVGADLMSLAKEAAMLAVERLSKAHGLLAPVALLGDALRANGLHFASSSSSSGGAMDESSIPGHVSAKEDQATAAPDAAAWAPAASTVVTSAVAAATTAPRPGHPHRVCGPLPVAALVDLLVTEADFLAATKLVQPTAKREGFAMAPDVSWDDIGALAGVRDELSLSVHTQKGNTQT
jgi:ribosome biogenesis ATPase